jgi:hypothetical protein
MSWTGWHGDGIFMSLLKYGLMLLAITVSLDLHYKSEAFAQRKPISKATTEAIPTLAIGTSVPVMWSVSQIHTMTNRPMSCADKPKADSVSLKTYGFRYIDSTGHTQFAVVNGKSVAILFAPSSNSIAVKSLLYLDWKVLIPNGTGQKIMLEGELTKRTHKVPFSPTSGYPEGFTYTEFVLHHWYLKVPFKERMYIDPNDPILGSRDILRYSLLRRHFKRTKGFNPADRSFNPKRYLKPLRPVMRNQSHALRRYPAESVSQRSSQALIQMAITSF